MFFIYVIPLPPISKRTVTLLPSSSLFRFLAPRGPALRQPVHRLDAQLGLLEALSVDALPVRGQGNAHRHQARQDPRPLAPPPELGERPDDRDQRYRHPDRAPRRLCPADRKSVV